MVNDERSDTVKAIAEHVEDPGQALALAAAMSHGHSAASEADIEWADEVLELLADAGLSLRPNDLAELDVPHPATADVRLDVLRALVSQSGDIPIEGIDLVSRWVATGELPKEGDQ